MGRKSKRRHNPDPDDAAKADKKEITALCTQLLEVAGRPSPLSPAKQWEEFLLINGLVEKVRKKQHDTSFESHRRQDHVSKFMTWACDQGISCDRVAVQDFGEQGLGLKAVKEIKEHEPFLTVPRSAMLTEDSMQNSPLGSLVCKDRVLQGMAHVALSLYLLMERQTEHSKWKPYINILPCSYQVPLYFTSDELQQLHGSPTFTEALKQHKNIARQFAYFYKLFQLHVDAMKLPLRDSFTYDGYRWAVSTVMSRQNQIPSEDGSRLVTALIPLWDMCNHTNGVISTSFNLQRDSCDGQALHDVAVGEQVCIFYGLRSNAHLMLYSGFVYPDSVCDSVSIQLGISKNDRLYALKSQLLAMMGSSESSINLAVEGGDSPISPELLAFLRVFSMDQEELVTRMFDKNKTESLGRLIRPNCLISKANELRVWAFLETRLSLLLRQYKTTVEEDTAMLSSSDTAANRRLCVQLRLLEKRILHNAVTYIGARRSVAEALPDDATCYQEEAELGDGAEKPAKVIGPEKSAGDIDGKAGPAEDGVRSDGSGSVGRDSSRGESDTCGSQRDSTMPTCEAPDSQPPPPPPLTSMATTAAATEDVGIGKRQDGGRASADRSVDGLNNAMNGVHLTNGDGRKASAETSVKGKAPAVSNGHPHTGSLESTVE